jgi:IPT/TIG domain
MLKRLSTALGLPLLCAAFAAVLLVPLSVADPGEVDRIPGDIPGDCSSDATEPILAWVASAPDSSVLSFTRQGCYLLQGTLELSDRRNLRFEGNGATFRSSKASTGAQALWRVVRSKGIVVRNMRIEGSYADGGTFDPRLQHGHGIDLRGSSIDIGNVTITDVGGDCVYFGRGITSSTRSSGSFHDSTCLRSGRNAVAVVAGDDIVVRRVRTDAIGYNVFDVEPNPGRGYGSKNVRFASNMIGSYAENVYSIVESGPIQDQFFTSNRVLGHGLKVAVGDPTHAGFRPARVTVAGNRSDTAQPPAAVNIDNVDGLTVRANTVRMTGGPMIAVRGSCGLDIGGNHFPGGSAEALVYPWVCSVTPLSGREGAVLTIRGSGFAGATRVEVGGTPACFTVRTASRVKVFVPDRATSGPITVSTPAGTAKSRAIFRITGRTKSPDCVPR